MTDVLLAALVILVALGGAELVRASCRRQLVAAVQIARDTAAPASVPSHAEAA